MPRPTASAGAQNHHNCQARSAAWHRRRPGGPGRYSAAAVRACRVIDAGNPRRGSACDGHKKGTGRGCTPGFCLACTAHAAMSPRTGGRRGELPRPLLFPHFFGKKWGPRPGRPRPARGYPREPSCRGRRPERSRTARRGRRAPRAGDSGGGGILSTPTGRGSYPPAGQASPYPSSSRSTCPAERAKSRAAERASWRVLPWVPTSTSTEPVDSCWLYREERMVMGRARVG